MDLAANDGAAETEAAPASSNNNILCFILPTAATVIGNFHLCITTARIGWSGMIIKSCEGSKGWANFV